MPSRRDRESDSSQTKNNSKLNNYDAAIYQLNTSATPNTLIRIVGNILAKECFKNLPLPEMRQKLSTDGKGELEEEIVNWFLEQDHDNALFAFSYFINPLCPSRLPIETCRDLFNQLSTAITDALQYGSLQFLRHRLSKKALIHETFGSVFTTQANVNACAERHNPDIGILVGGWQQALIRPVIANLVRDWTDLGINSVMTLSGSSGVGKTCAALDLARGIFFGRPPLVVYLNFGNFKNFSVARLADENKNQRNREVEKIMTTAIAEAIFGDYEAKYRHATGDCTASSHSLECRITPYEDCPRLGFHHSRDGGKTHVVVVVDDCCFNPAFLVGLTDVSFDLGKRLHNIFFQDKPTDENPIRVHFIAAGNVANFTVISPAFEMSEHVFVDLDSVIIDVDPISTLLKAPNVLFSDSEKSNLLRLSTTFAECRRCNEEPRSSAEEHAADLCTNFRAAASLLIEIIAYNRQVVAAFRDVSEKQWLHDFRKMLGHVLPLAVSRCASQSGLKHFTSPGQVIACAAAVDLHRLPFLPDVQINEIVASERKSGGSANSSSLCNVLCSSCGILVDQNRHPLPWWAVSRKLVDAERTRDVASATAVSLENVIPGAGFCKLVDLLSPRSNRFRCSRALLAMHRIAFGTAPSTSPDFDDIEHRFADFCLLLAPLSDIVERLYAAVNKEFTKNNINYFDAKSGKSEPLTMNKYLELLDKFDHFNDPLSRLKQLLRFGFGVSSAATIRVSTTPISFLDDIRSSTDALVDDATAAAFATFKLLKAKVRRERSVVVLTVGNCTNKSPGPRIVSDVIVVGPGKVILVRCVSAIDIESEVTLCWKEELAKMGVLVKNEDGNNNDNDREDKLRELWLATLIAAAASEASDFDQHVNNNTFKEFSTKNYFNSATQRGDVSLHVVFFVDCRRALALSMANDFAKNVKFIKNDDDDNNNNVVKSKTFNEATKQFDEVTTKFRNDLGLGSVDFVAVQRNDSRYESQSFATSSSWSHILPPSSTEERFFDLEACFHLANVQKQ